MARIGTALGGLILAGMVVFVVMAVVPLAPGGSGQTEALYFVPSIGLGGALMTAGVLLRRREVHEWGGY